MVALHTGGKYLGIVALAAALLCAFASLRRPSLRRYWRACLYFAVSMGTSAALVGFLKHHSQRPCPFKTDRYGGTTPHLGFFENLPPGVEYGTCFPAAHAAGAFALFSLYFIYRDSEPARARRALWFALVIGNLYGCIQIVRGQHFLSHQLWAGVIVWYLCMGIYWFVFRRKLRPSAAASA